jgi:hypothetical protein
MKKLEKILPFLAFVLILGPHVRQVLPPEEPPAPTVVVAPSPEPPAPTPPSPTPPATPAEWYRRIEPSCTPSDVRLAVDLNRPPTGTVGAGYEAACFAVAMDMAKARALILGLPEQDRLQAVSVIFNVAQAMVDRGEEMPAGPLMELVLEFWPNHYVALFEAGATRFAVGDYTHARAYLERFLEVYAPDDQRTQRAQRMMAQITER